MATKTLSRADEIRTQIKTVAESARDIAAKAEAEDRDFTDVERDALSKALKQVADLKTDLEALEAGDKIRADLDALDAEVLSAGQAKALNDQALQGVTAGVAPAPVKSLGQQFVESAGYKALRQQYPDRIPDSVKGIRVDSMPVGGMKALLTGADNTDSAGTLVYPQFLGLQSMGTWMRPLTIRDLITVGTTTSDTVEYARLVGVTNNAAPVPEATISGAKPSPDNSNTAGTKPESEMEFERVTANVVTIAHWLAATKRALSDAGQLRLLIDNFLRYGLEEELEDQIVSGDGTGENFEGILEVPGVQTQDFDTDPFVTIRKAITKVRVTGRAQATGIALHPADDEAIDLERDGDERFFGNGPFSLGPSTVWGVPRVVSEAVPEGTAILGDWRQAVLWDREQATISATDSHSDFFIRNLVAVLGELRAAFGVFKPQAFVAVDLSSS